MVPGFRRSLRGSSRYVSNVTSTRLLPPNGQVEIGVSCLTNKKETLGYRGRICEGSGGDIRVQIHLIEPKGEVQKMALFGPADSAFPPNFAPWRWAESAPAISDAPSLGNSVRQRAGSQSSALLAVSGKKLHCGAGLPPERPAFSMKSGCLPDPRASTTRARNLSPGAACGSAGKLALSPPLR